MQLLITESVLGYFIEASGSMLAGRVMPTRRRLNNGRGSLSDSEEELSFVTRISS